LKRRGPLISIAGVVVLGVIAIGLLWRFDHHGAGVATRDALTGGVPSYAASLGAAKPAVALGSSQTHGLTSMPWRFVGFRDDGRAVDVILVTGDGTCVTSVGVAVSESADRVVLAALSRTDKSQKACPSRLELARELVSLKAPIGQRALYHAPVSSAWNSPGYLQ
jgi:hypothetical protein